MELENTNNNTSLEQEKKKRKKDDVLGDAQILEYPNRTIPKLLEEAIEKNFPVVLTKDGYLVGGFYGLNSNILGGGFAFAQDTSLPNTLVFLDSKGAKHLVKNFEELVAFNSTVWGQFFKTSPDYKKPNSQWFPYMLEYGVLNISPK